VNFSRLFKSIIDFGEFISKKHQSKSNLLWCFFGGRSNPLKCMNVTLRYIFY